MNWATILVTVVASLLAIATAGFVRPPSGEEGVAKLARPRAALKPAGAIVILTAIDLGIVYFLTKIGAIGAEVAITLSGKGQEIKVHGAGLLGAFLAVFVATYIVWRGLNK